MKGFDPQFKDLTDYIIKITAEIWEGRAVGAIDRYYHKDAVRHTPYGDQVGVEPIIQDTLEQLSLFPDRQLLPQDVIGDQHQDDYHSSHRIIAVMHNRGEGIYGTPSGKLLQTYAIADCAVQNNQIYEEWELHDYKGLVLQLGYNPSDFVTERILPVLAAQSTKGGRGQSGQAAKNRSSTKASKGIGYKNQPDSKEAEDYLTLLRAIWEEKDLAALRRHYHPACILFLPGAECRYGCDAADAFFMSYLAALGNIRLSIDKVTTNKEKGRPLRVAVRWTLTATHIRNGRFGMPSQAPVSIMAISHLHFHQGRILAEWLLIDELSILTQIQLHKASGNDRVKGSGG